MNLLPTFPGKQVAFVDTSVTNYASLVAAVPEGVEVVLLDAAGSGLEQMAAWAASHAGYDAIHVLSHGTDGALTLGRETIDAQRLDDPAVRLLFQELGRALNPDGDLLLYGCSVAGGDVGQVFIDKLAGLTGADIAASTGLTGSAALGGDWRLEAGTGAIETMTLSAIGFDQVLGGVPPAAPTGLDLAAASDSGFSNTDNWTNIPTVVITGMAQPGTTVKLYGNDGTTVYGTTTAAGDGSWSITTIPLPTNVHRLRATATDAAGNESAASAILEVTLDTEAGPISITSDKSVLMPGETATITFGFIENPGTTFTSSDIIVAGGTLGPLSGSYPAFTAVFTPTPDASGTAQIEVPGNAFQDPAGNGNAPWSLNLPYLAAPTVSITSDKPALKVGETATITFTFSRDPGASFDSTDIVVTGGTLGALSGAGATRSAVFTPTGDVNAGTASIAVPANSYTDGYGNQGKAASLSSLSFDTRAPAAPLALDLAAGSDSGFSNTDNWTNIPTVVITGTAEAGATVKLYGNDGTTVYGTTTAAGDGSWSITTIPLPTNVHRLRATATDAAGNESAASAILEVTLDTEAGPVSITSDKSVLKAGETATVTFGFIENPGATFTRSDITVTGGTLGPLSGSGTTFTAVFTPTPDATGTADIEVPTNAFQDPAGNGNSFTRVNVLAYDTMPPAAPQALDLATASDTGDSNTDNLTKLPTPLIEGTAEAGAAITLYDSDGITVIGRGSAAGDGHWAVTTDALGSGTHTITAKATDTAGNDSAASTGLAVTIDAIAPTLAITSDKASLKAGETATVTLTFSEDPGSSFDASDIAVTGGTLGTLSGSGNTRTAVFTPSANTNSGTAGITVAAGSYSDSAGNDGGAGATPALTFDTAAPSLAIASDKAALRAGETATITFTFSEDPGATFDATDIAVSGGTLGSLSGSGTTRTAVFTPDANTDAGSASITVAAGRYADAAGNLGDAGASPSLTFDTAVPAAPLALDLSAASDTGASDSDNITRNRAPLVSGTAAAGTTVTLYGSDGSTALGSATAGGDGSWSITSSALADGTHTLTARARDAAGNASAASAPLQVTVDTTGPSLAISSDKAALKAGETATITFTFSENPGASFTSDDIVVSGGTLGALSGNGTTRTAVFTPDAATNGGSASITVAAGLYNDAAGNSGAPASTPALVFDTSAPAAPLALDLAAASDTGSSNSDNITRTTAPVISGTAEAGATVTVYDSDGSTVLGSATAAGDGSWSVTTSALGAGTHLLTARATDAAGNASAASASLAVTVDTTAPTLAITSDKAALKAGERATITFTFSEDPGATFTSADIAVTGGTLGALAGSGATRTAVFTPQANTNGGSAGITVAAGSYADTAGNGGGAGLAPPLSFDTAAPSLAITSDKAALKAGETATITFTFSEDTGASFTGDDIVVSGGTLGALSGNGTTRTAVFTPDAATDGGSASITVAAGLYNDAAGNSGTAAFTPALVFDTRAPAAPAAADLSAASDTGVSATDRITNNATPAFNGTAGPGTLVTLYGDDGKTALGTGTTAADGRWTIISAPLSAGKHALSVTATDAAGNVSLASDAMHVEIDTVAPSLLTAAVDGNTVTLTFDQEVFAPSAAGLLLTAGTSSYVASSISGSGTKVLSLALTSAVESGTQVMLAYDPAAASSELKDVAGNEVAGFAGRVLLNWTAPPVVTQQTEVTVDGVTVRQQLTVSDDGTTSQVMVIPVVAPGRVDAVGDNTVADIPLVKDAGGSSLLLAQVPVGMGVEVSGFAKPQPAGQSLTDLLRAIEARTGPGSSDQGAMTAGGTQFLSDLPKNNPLLVQTIIPTAAATGSTSTAPLVISAAPQAPGTAATALVVDASKLAPGAAIELPHVQFAAIVGAATITGGPGSHIIWGDSASQNMMLGSGDDIVHGGAGNDIVGGGAGNDRIFGDDGNDVVSGGEGNDFIDGGNGTDILQLSGAGRSDYQMRVENGLLVLTQRNGGIDGTDRVAGVETLRFMGANGGPGELDFTKSDVATLVRLYDSLFGRRPDEAGLNYWIERSESGMSMQAIAAGFIDSIEAGKQPPMGNQPFVQWLYQTGLHRSGAAAEIDYWSQALDAGMSRTDLVLAFADSAEHVKLVGVIGTSIDVL